MKNAASWSHDSQLNDLEDKSLLIIFIFYITSLSSLFHINISHQIFTNSFLVSFHSFLGHCRVYFTLTQMSRTAVWTIQHSWRDLMPWGHGLLCGDSQTDLTYNGGKGDTTVIQWHPRSFWLSWWLCASHLYPTNLTECPSTTRNRHVDHSRAANTDFHVHLQFLDIGLVWPLSIAVQHWKLLRSSELTLHASVQMQLTMKCGASNKS